MYTEWIFKPIVIYLILSLFVTFTNKMILGCNGPASTRMPYVLTGSHAIAGSIGTLTMRTQNPDDNDRFSTNQGSRNLTQKQHLLLAIFSLFYTINIVLSNLSLAVVSLAVHQTVRATAPVLTIFVSIFIMGRSWNSHGLSTYLSLMPVSIGVILAIRGESIRSNSTQNPLHIDNQASHTTIGLLLTFAGSLTAVLKTVLTHKLLRNAFLDLSPLELLSILSPYAAVQAFVFAHCTEGKGTAHSTVKTAITKTLCFAPSLTHVVHACNEWKPTLQDVRTVGLWTINAVAAFGLNVASFKASKTSGPVSIAVAANLKQVTILTLPHLAKIFGIKAWETQEATLQVLIGTSLTVAGSIWYAFATARVRDMNINSGKLEKAWQQRSE